MNKLLSLFICCIIHVSCIENPIGQSQLILDNWEFSKVGDTLWYPASVPGVVHTDLLKNDLIEDPYWGTNELKLQWIEEKNWNYRTTFHLSDKQAEQSHIEIEFEGLDTYATVWLNGVQIIQADNMFRKWKADIKQLVNIGGNSLEVHFESPLNHNRKLVESYPYKLPSGNETVSLKVGNFTRKAAYQFGWDWGPRFVTSGIWKNVRINTWNTARIENIFRRLSWF